MFDDVRLKIAKSALVAMSGGIDSTHAAWTLKECGLRVCGVYFKLFPENSPISAYLPLKKQARAMENAFLAAEELGIDFLVEDVSADFEREIINYFVNEYLRGRTPNPCIMCNPKIKFRTLYELSEQKGFDLIATGHYAVVRKNEDDSFSLFKARDLKKDQTYYLYRLNQQILKKAVFPNGIYEKEEIIRTFKTLMKKPEFSSESQEVCFIKRDYREFIMKIFPDAVKPGKFVDPEGKILGEHKGVAFYTVGQRRGLGIALGKRSYVIRIDPESDEVTIGTEEMLYPEKIQISDLSFISGRPPQKEFGASVKVRYRMKEIPCSVYIENGNAVVEFKEKCPFPAPGQSAVFYNDSEVIGGGLIDRWL